MHMPMWDPGFTHVKSASLSDEVCALGTSMATSMEGHSNTRSLPSCEADSTAECRDHTAKRPEVTNRVEQLIPAADPGS